MYTLMIIDDQYYIIDGIKNYVDLKSTNIQFMDYALDGTEGFEKIKTQHPDIVITDISMPNTDGLEMIKTLHEMKINTKYILLTGHENFQYAREAIQYGVISYILKPAQPSTIANALKEAVKICDAEKQEAELKQKMDKQIKESLPILREKFIEELISGTIIDTKEFLEKSQFLNLNFKDKSFRCMSMQINNYNDFLLKHTQYEQQLTKNIILETIASRFHQSCYLNFKKKTAVFLLTYAGGRKYLYEDDAISPFLYQIASQCGISLSFGIGNVANTPAEISRSYDESCECLKYVFCMGNIIFYNDIIHTQVISSLIGVYDRNELKDALTTRSMEAYKKCIDKYINNIKTYHLSYEHIKITAHEIASVILSTAYNFGENLYNKKINTDQSVWNRIDSCESLEEIEALLTEMAEIYINKINLKADQRTMRIIEQIIEFTEKNYSKNVSLKTLSKSIYLTPNYLGNIFARQMGMSFKDYLIKVRMEKAKELLLGGNYMVYEVSDMVGYKNLDFFRKTFKEYTGLNPSDLTSF